MTPEKIKINGIECLAIESVRKEKVDPNPDYPHVYEGRHGDVDFGFPSSIQQSVFVNHWGTILAKSPLYDHENEVSLEISEYEYEDGGIRAEWTEEDEEWLENEHSEEYS